MFSLFKKNNKSEFKFKEPENTACFVCDHVLNGQRPVLFAAHDSDDGSWQFMCGQTDHTEENAKIISLKQATQIDTTINELYEMLLGVGAQRDAKGSIWKVFGLE
jgi:hypothetical protein